MCKRVQTYQILENKIQDIIKRKCLKRRKNANV